MSRYPLLILCVVSFALLAHSLCTKPRVRRSWYSLTEEEKQLWIEAMMLMKTNGLYDQFVEVHNTRHNSYYAHGHSGFLVWHRWFIYIFENTLRELSPKFECITIPYWPSEMDAGHEGESPILRAEWFGTNRTNISNHCIVDGPFVNWISTDNTCIRRTFLPIYGYIGEAQLMSMIANAPIYGADVKGYRALYEGAPHAAPHNYLGAGGGHMGTMLSTNDPFFYLHHSNVDRIFALWQDCHDYDRLPMDRDIPLSAYEGTTKGLDGHKDTIPYQWERIEDLHPFFRNVSVTPQDIYWIKGGKLLDYTYEPGDRLRGLLDYSYGECHWDWFAEDHLIEASRAKGNKRHVNQNENQVDIYQHLEHTITTLTDSQLDDLLSENTQKRMTEQVTTSEEAKNLLRQAVRKVVKPEKEEVIAKQHPARQSLITAIRTIRNRETDFLSARGYSNEAPIRFSDPFYDEEKGAKVYRFRDANVQKLYEQIIKDNPYPQVPKRHQLQLTAIAECQLYGGKAHSSEEWITIQDMRSQAEVFAPICKYRYK